MLAAACRADARHVGQARLDALTAQQREWQRKLEQETAEKLRLTQLATQKQAAQAEQAQLAISRALEQLQNRLETAEPKPLPLSLTPPTGEGLRVEVPSGQALVRAIKLRAAASDAGVRAGWAAEGLQLDSGHVDVREVRVRLRLRVRVRVRARVTCRSTRST